MSVGLMLNPVNTLLFSFPLSLLCLPSNTMPLEPQSSLKYSDNQNDILICLLLTPTVSQSKILFNSSLNRNDCLWLGISVSCLFDRAHLLNWKSNEFPLTLFPLGIFHAQWSLRLQCHLLCAPQAFSGPQSFPLILHPPGSHPTFISHYFSPQPLCSHQQCLWFVHFHLCIFPHTIPILWPTSSFLALSTNILFLSNTVHPSSLQKIPS